MSKRLGGQDWGSLMASGLLPAPKSGHTPPLCLFSRREAQACLLEGSEAALQQEHKLSNGGLWAPSDRI